RRLRGSIRAAISRGSSSSATSSKTSHARGLPVLGSPTRVQRSRWCAAYTRDLAMIIARSPLRITLGGGGTDLPSYYRDHTGFLMAAAIDKFVYVTVIKPFVPGVYLKYSKIEHVNTIAEVQHPIVREALKLFDFGMPQIEITTLADIPSGTGLGSSGSFTTALLRALHAHARSIIHPRELAEQACMIEIEKLGEPIGKQ